MLREWQNHAAGLGAIFYAHWAGTDGPDGGVGIAIRKNEEELKAQVNEALAMLPYRERKVIELRFGLKGEHPRTLAEVSSRFNVSRERIRQIEAKALEQIMDSREIQALRDSI